MSYDKNETVNTDRVMSLVVTGLDMFAMSVIVEGKEFKVEAGSVYNEFARADLFATIIENLLDDDIIEEEHLLGMGVTQEEIDSITRGSDILSSRQ